ncbi:hypothetical protein K9N68_06825 [Kovacikia minuta CCNUW1]|nr:hypothetical protein K9N68_06825 [Kovacikia minuta CCNUW1]
MFAGEQYDSNLGDYYLRARYYSSDTGRFTRRDDFEGRRDEPLTLHRYIYTNSNPANGIDPTGWFTYSIADTAAAEAIRNDLIKQELLFAGRFIDDVFFGGAIQDFADVFTQLPFPNSPLVLRATSGGSVGGWIWKHEKNFGGAGHTILKRIWVDDGKLRERWNARAKSGSDLTGELSYFDSKETAEKAISQTIKKN